MQNIKIIKTQTAKITYTFNNITDKILKTQAVRRFSKLCNENRMTAKHVHKPITSVRVFSWVLVHNIKIRFEKAANWNCPAQYREPAVNRATEVRVSYDF